MPLKNLRRFLLLQQLHKGRVATKLDRAFRNREDVLGTFQHNLRICTVAGTHKGGVGQRHGCLDLKLNRPVLLLALRRNIFQYGVKRLTFQRTDRQFNRHAFVDLPDLRLIYIASEDHIVHIGDRGYRRTFVEVIALDH